MCDQGQQNNEVLACLERLDERMTHTIEAARQMGRHEGQLQAIQESLGDLKALVDQLGGKVNGLGGRLNGMEQRQARRDRRLGEQMDTQENISAELGALLAQAYHAVAESIRAFERVGQEPIFTPPTGYEPSEN
jgi:hypothetical protein